MTAQTQTDQHDQRDIVDELITDHREALQLLARIPVSVKADEQRELADIAIAEVVRHSVAEETYVYPAMREYLPDGEDLVNHDIEEHDELEKIMKELEKTDASDPAFAGLVHKMSDALRHHAQDEEANQFPRLRERVSHEQLVELRRKVDQAKRRAPTRPHPDSPNSELFHKIVGPGVGLVDRARDKLTGRTTTTK
jgi:hemerythrin superfamily protein